MRLSETLVLDKVQSATCYLKVSEKFFKYCRHSSRHSLKIQCLRCIHRKYAGRALGCLHLKVSIVEARVVTPQTFVAWFNLADEEAMVEAPPG